MPLLDTMLNIFIGNIHFLLIYSYVCIHGTYLANTNQCLLIKYDRPLNTGIYAGVMQRFTRAYSRHMATRSTLATPTELHAPLETGVPILNASLSL